METDGMARRSKYEYLRVMWQRYQRAGRRQRSALLDEVTRVCGYHRKYAIRLLGQPTPPRPAIRRVAWRRPTYSEDVIRLLAQVWEASGYLCAQRLTAARPTWRPWRGSWRRRTRSCSPSGLTSRWNSCGRLPRGSPVCRARRPLGHRSRERAPRGAGGPSVRAPCAPHQSRRKPRSKTRRTPWTQARRSPGRPRERPGETRQPEVPEAPVRFSNDATTPASVRFFDGLTGGQCCTFYIFVRRNHAERIQRLRHEG
jgi:hypothetical protein